MNDTNYDEKVNVSSEGQDLFRQDTFTVGHVDNVDQLQRHLGNRQVQLIAIGGQQAFSPPLRF
jgi:amino acid transporter